MKKLPLRSLIPNLFTFISLTFGLTAIKFAIDQKWQISVSLIVFASFLDNIDGKLARLLKTNSDFGVELDSLSDFVVFGTIPPITIYFWMGRTENQYLWIAAVLFIICSSLRLARFNSELSDKPTYAKNYFSGIPTPAAAFLALLPIPKLQFYYFQRLVIYLHLRHHILYKNQYQNLLLCFLCQQLYSYCLLYTSPSPRDS